MQNNLNEALSKLPRSGRIGRYVKILETKVDEDTLLRILNNADKYNSFSAEEKSAWWKNTVHNMEKELGSEKSILIMKLCGEKCCGKGQRKNAKEMMLQAGSIEKLLQMLNTHGVKEGELNYSLENDNTIIGEYNRCFCKQVASAKDKFESLTYCHCTVEFNKQFFQAAFGKSVEVRLEQSIICGAKSCRLKITY